MNNKTPVHIDRNLHRKISMLAAHRQETIGSLVEKVLAAYEKRYSIADKVDRKRKNEKSSIRRIISKSIRGGT